jgi:hypothetical protein
MFLPSFLKNPAGSQMIQLLIKLIKNLRSYDLIEYTVLALPAGIKPDQIP